MSDFDGKVLNVAIYWHHHQPFYKDLLTNDYILPWVRLHATKDYYDMVAILDEIPQMKVNFNLTPSLLVQLNDYATGQAKDKFLTVSIKPAEQLNEEDQIFILHNFFRANWDNMVAPYPRYFELLEKRGRHAVIEEIKRTKLFFKVQDYRDLQVWFNLSWIDPSWQKKDTVIKGLVEKGRNFTEEDKIYVLGKQQEICRQVISKYKEVQDRGQIEITTSAFYHPILPLLCDSEVAKKSIPQLNPKIRFSYPEDAEVQVRRAIEFYTSIFGHPPYGFWPPEGSVSEQIVPILAQYGIKWMATDEEILFRSLTPTRPKERSSLYLPYRYTRDNVAMNMVFRDNNLSDLIGFSYQKWNPKDAVNNLIYRLDQIRHQLLHVPEEPLVTILLDGENCWEHYRSDGTEFLHLLYQSLSTNEKIRTVTINEFLQTNSPRRNLTQLWPGSWINANFAIWFAHPEDQTGWEYLQKTRDALQQRVRSRDFPISTKNVDLAWESIYIAEGSDWYWWFGDEFASGQDEEFDFLFRKNLINVYELIGEKPPDYIHLAIKGQRTRHPFELPVGLISPKIDGLVTDYFEWQPAGFCQVGRTGGTMHQAESVLQSFYFGFDMQNVYFRFDTILPLKQIVGQDIVLKVVFLNPRCYEVRVPLLMRHKAEVNLVLCKEDRCELVSPLTYALNKIIEISLPFALIEIKEKQNVELTIVVEKNGVEIERWPYLASINFVRPDEMFLLNSWTV